MPSSLRIQQIVEVLQFIRAATPQDLSEVSTTRRRATTTIAERRGVDERTISDKCWRGLKLVTIEEFDRLVWSWLQGANDSLRQRLDECASSRSLVEDREAISAFFAGARPTIAPSAPVARASMAGKALVDHVVRSLTAEGLYFTYEQVADFYLSVRTKPFVLLAGISGTGKSLLPRRFAECCQFSCSTIPVRPDWSDPSDLLGYRNLQGAFVPGRLVEVIVDAWQNLDKPAFVVLDEMNLARVEHYLADFLSVIETRTRESENDTIVTDPVLRLSPESAIVGDESFVRSLRLLLGADGRLGFPPNLTVIGTVNMDESTHPFSKKVLDRAMTIELMDIDLLRIETRRDVPEPSQSPSATCLSASRLSLAEVWAPERPGASTQNAHLREGVQTLVDLNNALKLCSMQVGYRVRDELCIYLHHNADQRILEPSTALDLAVHHKVLPRLAGGEELRPVLEKVSEELRARRLPRSREKVRQMIQRLDDSGYTAFWS